MKTIYSPMLLVLVFTSCNSEEPKPIIKIQNKSLLSKPILANAGVNLNNPYDNAGLLYVELTSAYLSNETTYSQMILASCHNICNANLAYLGMLPTNYLYSSQSEIGYYIGNDVAKLHLSINASGLSTTAKTSLSDFITEVESKKFQGVDFETLLGYIVGFEDGIGSSGFSAADKKLILTVSSIIRHANHLSTSLKKQKPRDRNWDITMGLVAATIDGASQSMAKAIENAFVVGICSNPI